MLARSMRGMATRRAIHTSQAALARAAAEAATSGDTMILNFSMPSKSIYRNQPVTSVVIPGLAGEYGVTKKHSPIISELKAGVVQVLLEGETTPEKYFVSGGFALTHANSVTDIAVNEAAKLDDIDADAVPKLYAEAVKDMTAAPEGSKAKAEAQIEVEVAKSLASALGMRL